MNEGAKNWFQWHYILLQQTSSFCRYEGLGTPERVFLFVQAFSSESLWHVALVRIYEHDAHLCRSATDKWLSPAA